ncbi:MAG TPA: riboflavin synthase [Flavobacteriaceae bacterium]|nr:riboflavin synthase [Flavobacteriaceae bacterium]
MFTGIIETVACVKTISQDGGNVHFIINTHFANELKIDQSICHNGVCLTVVELFPDAYRVTAIAETLSKTNLGLLKEGSSVNLERAIRLGDRLDGHIVQGHVDGTATCVSISEADGSFLFKFKHDHPDFETVPKGSITVDGVSLTVVESGKGFFSVAIIPFTFAHTTFHKYEVGTVVNIEFDVIGKYIKNLMKPYL